MKKLALAAIAASALAAPAFADGHAANFAVMHFNSDQDTPSDRRMLPTSDTPTVMALSPDSTLAEVLDQFNMNAESVSDMRGNMGVTIIANDPGVAQQIFDLLAEEDMEMGQ